MKLFNHRMVKAALMLSLIALILVVPIGAAYAAAPTVTAAQPNKDCAVAGVTPGHAASASGSAFNPSGKAGTVYAGQQPQNSKNPMSVSQYDVACYQVSIH